MYNIEELKTKTNCRDVAQSLLGQPIRSVNKRDLYTCPFHNESTPSFWVYEDGWRCYGQCAESGSVLDLVIRVKGMDFKAACEYLGASQFVSETPLPKVSRPEPEPPNDEWQKSAFKTISFAKHYLFSQSGQLGLRYLTEVRKLEAWAAWEYNLGYLPLPSGATKQIIWNNYFGVEAPCGITLPSFDPNSKLWGVRVRLPKPPVPLRPDQKPEKYRAFTDGKLTGSLFGGDNFIPELPVYLDEGEFNTLAVLGCRYDVPSHFCGLALSSVNNDLSKAWLDRLLFSPVVFIRTDSGSGDKVAEQLMALSKRFVRVQVPDPYKDPNELLMKEGKPALIEWVRGFLK